MFSLQHVGRECAPGRTGTSEHPDLDLCDTLAINIVRFVGLYYSPQFGSSMLAITSAAYIGALTSKQQRIGAACIFVRFSMHFSILPGLNIAPELFELQMVVAAIVACLCL